MTDLFIWLIYCGGVFTFPNEKRGFFGRLGWPIELGEAIYHWARGNRE